MAEEKITRADLEAMREEHDLVRAQEPGGGLPFNLDDDIHQAHQMVRFGSAPEEWAKARGVPVDYAHALLRYIRQR
jgi:hypothetical protein